ncbi:MAG: hypothetical protein IVW52_18905 [Acidimicrobiales bacterium]|nr:hypothetical protein [Acidimicrobiales bacterium]
MSEVITAMALMAAGGCILLVGISLALIVGAVISLLRTRPLTPRPRVPPRLQHLARALAHRF